MSSIVLALGFVGIQFLPLQLRFFSIASLGLFTAILFIWSLWEGLGKNATLLTLILPTTFTISVGFFWFLLPTSIFAKIPIIILFGIGIYALCLTSNIYTVASIRTIALLRAARGVGFVLTLLTLFLVFDTILSFKWPIYLTPLIIALLSLPLFVQGFWFAVLDKDLSKKVVMVSLVSALVVGEIAGVLYFWPVRVVVGSLFLTVAAYVLLGLGQAKLEERLFVQTSREYLLVGLAVIIGMFLATRWSG